MTDPSGEDACYEVTPEIVEYEPEDGELLAIATFWNRSEGKMVTLARSTLDEDDDGVEICLGNQELQHVTRDLTWRFESGDLVISFPGARERLGGFSSARVRLGSC